MKTYRLGIAGSSELERGMDDLQVALRDVCEEFRKPASEPCAKYMFEPVTYIVAVLSSPLAVEFAKALGGWLLKNRSAKITIQLGEDGKLRELSAEGLNQDQVMELALDAVVADDPGLTRLVRHSGKVSR